MVKESNEAPLVYQVGQHVVIYQHLELEGYNLREYPGFEIGTVHTVTAYVGGHYLLDDEIAVLADEISEHKYA